MDRKTKLLWMKDILEHLGDCFEEWQLADPQSERFLAEAIERDLDEFRRLCSSLRRDASPALRRRQAALA
jgi:hypothetical protein